jgi:GTPase SAR1 family protein
MEPQQPIYLDLSQPMAEPLLLAAGAVGGLGNPHFLGKDNPKPKFATVGTKGTWIELELELKLLADVGLVGLPNAGKSTLLRSITNSRTRVGNWPFTTLSPKIGTVILDNNVGRPVIAPAPGCPRRTRFSIADIPGLVEGAHQDKGLGLGFLRHVDRAGILAFVIDLSAGDAVQALKTLWCELDEYQINRERELNLDTEMRLGPWRPDSVDPDEPLVTIANTADLDEAAEPLSVHRNSSLPVRAPLDHIYTKPWFVVGTKADLPGTQENFMALRAYLAEVQKGTAEHPCRRQNGWRERLFSFPVSAINAEGVDVIPKKVVELLDGTYHRS